MDLTIATQIIIVLLEVWFWAIAGLGHVIVKTMTPPSNPHNSSKYFINHKYNDCQCGYLLQWRSSIFLRKYLQESNHGFVNKFYSERSK